MTRDMTPSSKGRGAIFLSDVGTNADYVNTSRHVVHVMRAEVLDGQMLVLELLARSMLEYGTFGLG